MSNIYGGYGPGMPGSVQGAQGSGDNIHETVGAYALGILDDAEATQFEMHLATCEWCGQQLDELAGMEPMLAALADLPAAQGTPAIGESLSAKPSTGLADRLVGEVVQQLVDSEVAGVMFTRNPMTGANERVIEASWGLGEAVVAGIVTPDHWEMDVTGQVTSFIAGEKDIAIRRTDTGTVEVPVDDDLVDVACLNGSQLRELNELALACDAAYGTTAHDIEFAFAGGQLFLLQRRPITGV